MIILRVLLVLNCLLVVPFAIAACVATLVAFVVAGEAKMAIVAGVALAIAVGVP